MGALKPDRGLQYRRLLASMTVVQGLIPALLAAASQLSAQMSMEFFVPFCTTMFAILARIQVRLLCSYSVHLAI